MKCRNALFKKFWITVEYTDKKFRHQFQDSPACQCIDNTDCCDKFNCFFYPVIGFFSIIKTHNRRSTCGQPVNRHGKNITDRVQNGHHSHINISTPGLECRITDYLHQAVGKSHKKSGHSKTYDVPHTFPGNFEGTFFQVQNCFFPT